MPKNKHFDGEAFITETNKNLKRLFFKMDVLNNEAKKAQIDAAVQFYAGKMGDVSSPAQIASIIYSEYAIKHFKGSVLKGYSALWSSARSAFRGVAALPVVIAVTAVITPVVLASIAIILLTAVVFAVLAVGGLFYLFAGLVGLSVNTISAMAFVGVGLMALGTTLFFARPIKNLIKSCNYLISVPIFALSICVRQYSRSKRIHLTR